MDGTGNNFVGNSLYTASNSDLVHLVHSAIGDRKSLI